MVRKFVRMGLAILLMISLVPAPFFAQESGVQRRRAGGDAAAAPACSHLDAQAAPPSRASAAHGEYESGLFDGEKMVSQHSRVLQAGNDSRAALDEFSAPGSVAAKRKADAQPAGRNFTGAGK